MHRSFLLKYFTSLATHEIDDGPLLSRRRVIQQNINLCVDAATRIIEQIDRIDAAGELYSTLFVRSPYLLEALAQRRDPRPPPPFTQNFDCLGFLSF